MPALHESYRPRSWSEVVAQDKVVATINRLRPRGLSGRSYFVTGAFGTGKTTIARLIASETAEPISTTEIDGSEVTAEVLDEIRHQRQLRPYGKGFCLIIDECHILKDATVTKLLKLTEDLPPWVTIIFCTSSDGIEDLAAKSGDFAALLSRCTRLNLARRDLAKPFAERALTVARAVGMDGRELADYVKLLQKHNNNLRGALCEIEAGCMLAK